MNRFVLPGVKPLRNYRVFLCAAALLLLAFGSGCAPLTRAGGGIRLHPESLEHPRNGWWYAGFHMNWPEGTGPAWSTDLLIAHRVVAPVLTRFESNIVLWRFHRRAARDEAGHRFSFIFYSTPETARKVYAALDSSAVLEDLKTAGIVLNVAFDDTNKITRPQIEDTSDRHWSEPLQKSWPYFIMGVSRTWLDLIEQFANDGRPKPLGLDAMQAFYRDIDESIGTTWMKEGSHAFLHHLNAVFGYIPVIVNGKYPVRF
jgi:hypothetical protein